MHGQTATRRNDELRSQRTAAAPITPARTAAQNGCRNRFALSRFRARRTRAPAPALTKISMAAQLCWTPKITANATAPAAAASAKRPVGDGGDREIWSIVFLAEFGARRPAAISSIARIVDATRSISTPTGAATAWPASTAASLQATSGSAPQRAMLV